MALHHSSTEKQNSAAKSFSFLPCLERDTLSIFGSSAKGLEQDYQPIFDSNIDLG